MNAEKELEPLLIAIKAEKKAIEYYARAARRITNPTGKEALGKLKLQEEMHYRNLKKKFKKLTGRELRSEDEKKVAVSVSALTEEHLPDAEASDLEVCQVALDDEKNAHGFY